MTAKKSHAATRKKTATKKTAKRKVARRRPARVPTAARWKPAEGLPPATLPPLPQPPAPEDAVRDDPPPSNPPKKAGPSARSAIVSAACYGAIAGPTRRRLKTTRGIALVILVPGPSWIAPVKASFLDRYGKVWEVFEPETSKSPGQRADRNTQVANHLSCGQSVVGIAVDSNSLPTGLSVACDLTVRLNAPRARTIARAIRMFTGVAAPVGIDDAIVAGLEFHDIVAAFRAGSTPVEILARLRNAASSGNITASERLPKLADAAEYGAARTWGMTLARDLADYRAGRLDWQDVDRGVILFSEPGLGKTLFARILAQACGVPLVAFSIADLFAGSAGYLDSVIKASRAMFERAAAVAPCILFLDEIDALPNRATMSPRGADWWTSVITDFLLSLDNAVAGKRAGIVVVAATNNIAGVDAAILRPGRLERAIEVQRPDYAGVVNILRHHVDGALPESDIAEVAHLLEGTTGAEIMMIVRDARRVARYAGRQLQREDILEAIAPAEDFAPDMLRRICIHEAAHAVASIVVSSGVLTRCIAGSSTGASGRTLIRHDQQDMLTRNLVERRIVVMLCGRTAETLLIGSTSLGAGGDESSDLAQATLLVATLHASTGLGDTLTYLTSHRDALTAVRDDRELRLKVEQHLRVLQTRAEEVVQKYRNAILAVAEQLRLRRQLSGDEVRRIVEAIASDQIEAAQ
jgi:hypothetical protein